MVSTQIFVKWMNEKIEFNAQVSLLELLISNYASLKPSYSVIKKTNKKNELPWWLSGEESTCQCRRHGFDPWSRKILYAVVTKSVSYNCWACALEPRRHNYWAHVLKLLKPCQCQRQSSATREATTMRSLHTAIRE